MSVVRWRFDDYWGSATYTLPINPNDGGTPAISKSVAMSQASGPNRVNILQEGRSTAPQMPFSGVIVEQAHLEALEQWFDKRVFIQITDDLGRHMFGIFTQLNLRRVRRASNPWFHTFDAEFTLSAYQQASGQWVFGRVS